MWDPSRCVKRGCSLCAPPRRASGIAKLTLAGVGRAARMTPKQGTVRQLGDMLAKGPILRAAEEALNANPLREVVPVDWAEIARALRTVWVRSLAGPTRPWPPPPI